MATVTIELDDGLLAQLSAKAAAESTTVEALMIEATARHLHGSREVAPEVRAIIDRQIATYRRVFDRLAE